MKRDKKTSDQRANYEKYKEHQENLMLQTPRQKIGRILKNYRKIHQSFTVKDVQNEQTSLKRETIRFVIHELIKEGLIEIEVQGRGKASQSVYRFKS